MSDYSNCVFGCKHFAGGEVHHHKDCSNYPESRSKRFDEMKAELKKYKKEKRKPVDGKLSMTKEEIVEFESLFIKKGVMLESVRLGGYDRIVVLFMEKYDGIYLNNYKAILWLAERFNLEV